jgi:tRNA U34 2-thiouridine synthase MnmA/TrmU
MKSGKKKQARAIALLSGGLDSILAAKLIKNQGIDVIGVTFSTPFFNAPEIIRKQAEQINIPLKIIHLGKEYIRLIRKPRHGYGSAINPCIDCHTFFLKKAKPLLRKLKADFIITGEVLGQRPMSQHRKALSIIEKEAGLKGILLRPLSAKLLPPTIPEKKSMIKRNSLLSIHGKNRKPQINLAKKLKITIFQTPAGGCILTNKEYAKKLKDLFANKKRISEKDISLLKIGRHFRIKGCKIIVARNQEECLLLQKMKSFWDMTLEPSTLPGPTSLIKGKMTKSSLQTAAQLTARYTLKDKKQKIPILCSGRFRKKTLHAAPISESLLQKLKI